MKIRKNGTFFTHRVMLLCVMVVISLFSTSFLASSASVAVSISETVFFEQPEVVKVRIGDQLFDRVLYNDAPGYGRIGAPKLPAFGMQLLLPPGKRLQDVSVSMENYHSLGMGFSVEPVQKPLKLSEVDSSSISDDLQYGSSEDIDEGACTVVGTYWFRGYPIVSLLLHPVLYDEQTGELGYFETINLDVSVSDSDSKSSMFRYSFKDNAAVSAKVYNPEMSSSYQTSIRDSSLGGYDLLILTTADFASAFQPLKQAHEGQGLSTEIKTLRDISLLPGKVTAEDIRSYIREQYLQQGIDYVLIGGDDNIIPAKQLWVQSWPNGETTTMPSDLYYACLDGTYNYDADERWGEPTDGDEGGDVDLLAEVYVGRASCGSVEEVDSFVTKTVSFLNNDGLFSDEVVMVGEFLWSNPDTWGGDYMDELINQSSSNMYQTTGIPWNQFSISTVYDRDWESNHWPKSEIINRINNNVAIINHLGHSSPDYNMKLVNSDVASLTNSEPFFFYSQGCTAGAFDYEDCIAEFFTVKTEHAAIAAIMNARYGWGVRGSTDGPNQRYHREFWDAIFGEDIPEIGKANQDSKEDSLSYIEGSCMRWCYYQLNLFGDPTLRLVSSSNTAPEKPARPTIVEQGKIGEETTFTTNALDNDGDDLYYKWDFDDGTTSEWIGPFASGEEIEISHSYERRGVYHVKVLARDSHLSTSDWSDTVPIRLSQFTSFPLLDLILQILDQFFPRLSIY